VTIDLSAVLGIFGAATLIVLLIVALDLDLEGRKRRRDAHRRNHARRR
jgi:hypothetical protein